MVQQSACVVIFRNELHVLTLWSYETVFVWGKITLQTVF